MIALSLFGQNLTQAQVATKIDIQNYVKKANNPRIQYKDGAVLFFADPSSFVTVGCGLASLVSLWFAYNLWIQDNKKTSALYGLNSALFVALAIKPLLDKFSKTPLVVLDKKGFSYNNLLILEWADVAKLCITEDFSDNLIDVKNYVFGFLGQDGNFLFEWGDKPRFPIETTKHLLRLIYYYRSLALSLPIESLPANGHYEN
jgi:hypothetical protein